MKRPLIAIGLLAAMLLSCVDMDPTNKVPRLKPSADYSVDATPAVYATPAAIHTPTPAPW